MRKILSVLFSFIMLIALSTSAFAVDHAQYGLEATVTPSVLSDSVSFNVSVENISNEDVESVTVESSFPQGLSPSSSTKNDFGSLAPDEKADFTVTAKLSSSPLTLTIGEKAHNATISTIAISSVVVIALIALLILAVKNKNFRKIFVLFLCISLAVPNIGFIPTFAKDANDSGFEISETVNLKGTDYTVKFNFSLENKNDSSYLDCKNEESVDDATQDIAGTIVSDEEIISVDYEVYSEIDKGDLSFSGEAELNGGHYTISDTVLKPDNNEIKITATTKSGKKITDTFNVDYDSSSVYKESDADISTDKDSGKKYINSIINVLFTADATDTDKKSVLKELDGEKVGYINGANMWQIKVEKSDLDTLNTICDELSKKSFVASAYVDYLDISPNVIPDDPWGNSSWNEDSPAGNNWSVEMVKALSAWDYDRYFNDINIGFVDSGCDYDHEDLNGKVYFTSTENEEGCDEQNHGTHIAGIMGAIPNNQKGSTGILWNGKVYAHDASPNNGASMTTTACYNGIVQNIEAGAKVVNLSVGLSTLITLTETDISNFSTGASSYVAYLINQGYDFIICQSSGNGNSSGTAVDTRMNGMFCCIDQDETGQSAAMAKKIADRIMIVGSMNSGGSQATSSNYGAHVDLAAPGVSVYSTIIGDYGKMSGTSMSSPLVTAILGVVWSVNPELTGAEVADIVKTTAASYRSAYASVTGQTALPVPNLLTAVQAAVATLPSTDFAELDNAISLVPEDLTYYDVSSVDTLNAAFSAAKSLDRNTASQNQVNEITRNLLDALYSLTVSLASPAQLTIPKTLTVNGWGFPEVKFTCPGATDIEITFSNNNIVDTKQSGTTDTATVILSGSSPTKDDIGTITCTVTYKYGGVTHTLKRYIEVVEQIFAYQPLVDTSIARTGGSYLSGYNPSLYNIATINGTVKAVNPIADASNGYFDFDTNSFVCDENTAVGTQWGGYQLSGTIATNLMDDRFTPKGYLYVDPSEYSQLSEVPNLGIYIYQYKKCTRASGGTEVLSVTTDNNNYTVNVEDTELGTSANSVGGSQTYKINGPVPTKTTTIRFYIQTQAIATGISKSQTTTSQIFLDLVVVPQSKAQLESLLNNLYSANHQSLFYTSDSFEKYSEALEFASVVYNNPYSEQYDIDKAYNDLSDAFFGLEFDSLASYVDLNHAISSAKQIDDDLYTDYSLGLLDEIITSAEAIPDNYFKPYQSYIDSKTTELLRATEDLPLLCGDLDANKVVDGNDAFIMSCIISGTLSEEDLGEYKYSAADANKDGTVDFDDYGLIFNKGLNP